LLSLGLVFVTALVTGVLLARQCGLAWRRVLCVSSLTLLTCAALARPLSAAALWIGAPAHVLPAHLGLFGHSTIYPSMVGIVALPLWWRQRTSRGLDRMMALAITMAACGYGLLKVRCLLFGCCFGARTFGWWAIQYGADRPATLKLGANHWIHPVQLYESICSGVVFVWLARSLPRAQPRRVACAGVALLCLLRLATAELRYADGRAPWVFWGFRCTENVALSLVGLCASAALLGALELRARHVAALRSA
jgi:prolipoprotein diacylglyceryltransferase